MPLDVPKIDLATGKLQYYDSTELAQIDLRAIGVSGEGDHISDEMGRTGSISTRRYSCAWNERYAAALALVGFARSYTDTDGKLRISRLQPDVHPAFYTAAGGGALRNWVCTSVKIDPFAFDGTQEDPDFGQDVPNFRRAHLTAGYELVGFDTFYNDDELAADQEYLRYRSLPGFPGANVSTKTNMIGQLGSSLIFRTSDGTTATGPAGKPIPYNYGRMESLSEKKVIHHRIPLDCWGDPSKPLYLRVKGDGTASNRGFFGALNLTEFVGIPPLCAQLIGVEEVLLPDPSGLGYCWDLGWQILEKTVPFGHLGFLWPGDGSATALGESEYYQVGRRGGATVTQDAADVEALPEENLFPAAELNDIFQVGVV